MGNAHPETGEAAPQAQRQEGVLSKESQTLKNWNERYFVLSNRALNYWSSERDFRDRKAPSGKMDLDRCRLRRESEVRFEISSPADEARRAQQNGQFAWLVQAPSASSAQAWISALRIGERGTLAVRLCSRRAWANDRRGRTRLTSAPLCSPVVLSHVRASGPSHEQRCARYG